MQVSLGKGSCSVLPCSEGFRVRHLQKKTGFRDVYAHPFSYFQDFVMF